MWWMGQQRGAEEPQEPRDMTYHIGVTGEDIRDGEEGDGYRCRVARALARVVPGFEYSYASFCVIQRQHVRLPEEATRFVCAFDVDQDVQPFEFDVTVP